MPRRSTRISFPADIRRFLFPQMSADVRNANRSRSFPQMDADSCPADKRRFKNADLRRFFNTQMSADNIIADERRFFPADERRFLVPLISADVEMLTGADLFRRWTLILVPQINADLKTLIYADFKNADLRR